MEPTYAAFIMVISNSAGFLYHTKWPHKKYLGGTIIHIFCIIAIFCKICCVEGTIFVFVFYLIDAHINLKIVIVFFVYMTDGLLSKFD